MKATLLFLVTFFMVGYWWQHRHRQHSDCLVLKDPNVFNSVDLTFHQNTSVLIRAGQIHSFLSGQENFSGCEVKDLSGYYLLPGFIDAHTHLMASDGTRLHGWKQALEAAASKPEMTRLFQGEQNALSMLKAGFTTVRDLGNSGNFLDAKLSDRIRRNISSGPLVIYSGPGLALLPSQIDIRKNPAEYRILGPTPDFSRIFKEYRSQGATWIKIYFDNSDRLQPVHPELLKQATAAAKQAGFKVAAHAEYAESVALALSSGVDSIEHFFEIPAKNESTGEVRFAVVTDESLKTCKTRGFSNDCDQHIQNLQRRLRWLKDNHFKIAFGSDAFVDFNSGFRSRGEASISSLISLTNLGLSPTEAITAATSTAADMLELQSGRIEPGKIADLIAFAKNPVIDPEIIRTPSLVIHNGQVVCDGTKECAQ